LALGLIFGLTLFANQIQYGGDIFLLILFLYNIYIWFLQYFYMPHEKGIQEDYELQSNEYGIEDV